MIKRKFVFLAAAVSLPKIGLSVAAAQSPPEESKVKFQYSDYQDYEPGDKRMRVKAPMGWFNTAIGEKTEVEGAFVYDSMSGASPFFLNTLTGASGLGVEDIRRAGDLKVTQYFDRFSIGVGGVYSDEDDYTSRGGLIEGRIWSEDKNRTFAIGFSGNNDDITSTNNLELSESRKTCSVLFGITQIIDTESIIQSNITFTTADGYITDPYKSLDERPRSRDQYAWLVRYNYYLSSLDASLHNDYRFYIDTWGIYSHMFEVALYQPLGSGWMIRPNVRYYSQSSADFFSSEIPSEFPEGFYSLDQRLSAFGALTTGVKVIKELESGLSFDIGIGWIQQRDSFKLGSGGSDNISPFFARFINVGVTKSF